MRTASPVAPKLVVGGLLVLAAFGIVSRPEAAPAAVAETRVATAVDALPPEFRAIRPADLDGGVAPIPAAELWPAQ